MLGRGCRGEDSPGSPSCTSPSERVLDAREEQTRHIKIASENGRQVIHMGRDTISASTSLGVLVFQSQGLEGAMALARVPKRNSGAKVRSRLAPNLDL